MATLQKYTTPQAQKPVISPRNEARSRDVNFNNIAPPPSGLAPGQQEPVAQLPTSVEAPPKVAEAPSDQQNPQFVALARKERQLRKAQQEFKAQQEAWKQEQAKYLPKERLTSETLQVLAEAGITPDKLVELQINQAAGQDPNQPLLDRISELESKLNGITDPENGTLAKRDKEQYEAAVSQIRSDVKLLVDSNPAYGTVKSEGKQKDVTDLITAVFDEEGIVLDVEEAAQLVEDKLVERLTSEYERISKYDKITARLRKSAEQTEAITEQQSPQPKITTLTNAGATTRQLSARDRAVLAVQARMDALKGR